MCLLIKTKAYLSFPFSFTLFWSSHTWNDHKTDLYSHIQLTRGMLVICHKLTVPNVEITNSHYDTKFPFLTNVYLHGNIFDSNTFVIYKVIKLKYRYRQQQYIQSCWFEAKCVCVWWIILWSASLWLLFNVWISITPCSVFQKTFFSICNIYIFLYWVW